MRYDYSQETANELLETSDRAHEVKDAEITTLTARLAEVERERDSFQRIGKHYESVLHKAAENLNPGGTGRTAALVVTQDLPKIISDLAATRALLRTTMDQVRIANELIYVGDPLYAQEVMEKLLSNPALVALLKEETK